MLKESEAARVLAEKAVAARSRFVAVAGHELRQPLQSMVLYIELIRRNASTEQKRILDNLSSSMFIMREMAERLLEISRLDAGLVVMRPEPVQLSEMLERLHRQHQHRATIVGSRLRLYKSALWVMADPAALERILLELLDNAFKCAARRPISIGCFHTGGMAIVCVVDSGIGIRANRVDEIFDDFNRSANSDIIQATGLGLGLWSAGRLADAAGYRLRILATVQGRGTAVAIELPLVDAPAERKSRTTVGHTAVIGQIRIAVIEDDALVL